MPKSPNEVGIVCSEEGVVLSTLVTESELINCRCALAPVMIK